ncbi:LPXTG cell wall anchor domain-containing protein [Microbacterium oleivorans]|nr:LPXTG cell wall anchor domain-containing protein [Microbacterium oleivorans]THE06709.1 LPXTG cell wall anchor domain-containing protein [Microbacterium oleivorans]
MLLLSAGVDTGRLSSWALLGIAMGLAIVAIAFYKKRKQSRR